MGRTCQTDLPALWHRCNLTTIQQTFESVASQWCPMVFHTLRIPSYHRMEYIHERYVSNLAATGWSKIERTVMSHAANSVCLCEKPFSTYRGEPLKRIASGWWWHQGIQLIVSIYHLFRESENILKIWTHHLIIWTHHFFIESTDWKYVRTIKLIWSNLDRPICKLQTSTVTPSVTCGRNQLDRPDKEREKRASHRITAP